MIRDEIDYLKYEGERIPLTFLESKLNIELEICNVDFQMINQIFECAEEDEIIHEFKFKNYFIEVLEGFIDDKQSEKYLRVVIRDMLEKIYSSMEGEIVTDGENISDNVKNDGEYFLRVVE